jgi:NAD-dependent SIR2 family protein deacetylase
MKIEGTAMITNAVTAIKKTDGLLITAGAGMGVDSGLPDFRGNDGFWMAYPALKHLNLEFHEIASGKVFADNPRLAWAFYGHRLNLYRKTTPHDGFRMLKEIGEQSPHGYMVYTSNVDGAFQKYGFDPNRVVECHGSIHFMQCSINCQNKVWSANDFIPEVDEEKFELINDLPFCPDCGEVARPNIMMFDDYHFCNIVVDAQIDRMEEWRKPLRYPVTIEIGAGTAISTARRQGEYCSVSLIRINPVSETVFRDEDIPIKMGGLDGISAIHRIWAR